MRKRSAKYTQKIDVNQLIAEAFDEDLAAAALLLETEIANRTPVVTGRLKSSMAARKVADRQYEVATDVNYALWVEYGTSRFAPRAMMRRGADAVDQKGMLLLKKTARLAKK